VKLRATSVTLGAALMNRRRAFDGRPQAPLQDQHVIGGGGFLGLGLAVVIACLVVGTIIGWFIPRINIDRDTPR